MVSLRSQSPGSSRERGKPYRASRGFRGINGVLPAARVPSIYSTVLLTPFQAGGVRPMSGTDPNLTLSVSQEPTLLRMKRTYRLQRVFGYLRS